MLVHLHERPSPQLLESSFQELVENNDALRIQFAVISGEVRQQVFKNINVPIETYTSAEFCEKALETFVRPFELDRAPLWKIALVDCADGLFLFFDIHHIIICDGLTKSMLFADWSSIYNKREIVHADLPFAFYAAWTDDVEGRDRVLEKVGAQVNFSIGAKHLMLLRDLAKKFKVILFQLLFAGHLLWIWHHTGSDDFLVGAPALGRNKAGTDKVYRMFVNTVCIRLQPKSYETFESFVHLAAKACAEAIAHQDFPFSELVKVVPSVHDETRGSIFDTMFSFYSDGLHNTDFLDGVTQ